MNEEKPKEDESQAKPSCSMQDASKSTIEPSASGSQSLKTEVMYHGEAPVTGGQDRWLIDTVESAFVLKPPEVSALFASDKHAHAFPQALVFQQHQGQIPTIILENFVGTNVQPKDVSIKIKKDPEPSTPGQEVEPTSAPQFFCHLCNQKFTRQSNLSEHMLRHAGKSFICEICKKNFTCLRYLSRHLRIHNVEPPKKSDRQEKYTDKSYVCTYCTKRFSCKSHLVAHTRIHTGEKPFVCQVCSKTFNHKSHLTAHTRIHTGEKPFTCRICLKQFRDPSNLAGHMRVHDGEKTFACQYCEEQFSLRMHLRKHEKEHTGLQKHTCNECGKGFNDASKLRIHSKTHGKKIVCSICSNEFKVKFDSDKPYVCEECTKNFSNGWSNQKVVRLKF